MTDSVSELMVDSAKNQIEYIKNEMEEQVKSYKISTDFVKS